MKKKYFPILLLILVAVIIYSVTRLYNLITNNELAVGKEYHLIYNVQGNDIAGYNYADFPEAVLEKDEKVIVTSINGDFVEVKSKDAVSWINKWYLESKKSTTLLDHRIEYVLDSTNLRPFPSETAVFSYDELVEIGTVVIIEAEYQNWYCVQVLRYSEPMYDNYWIKKEAVGILDDEFIREGHIKNDAELTTRQGNILEIETDNYVIVKSYDHEHYIFEAPGGITGLVKKSDFMPLKSLERLF